MQSKRQSKMKMGLVAIVGMVIVTGSLVKAKIEKANNPYRAVVRAHFYALSKQMNVSDAQKTSIAALLRQSMLQGQAIAKDNQLSQAQKQQKIKALREGTKAKIVAVLTPAQRQNAQKIFDNRRQRMQQVVEEVGDELQLSNKQRAEAKPIIEEALQKGHAIWADAATFGQKRAQLVQLHGATREKLASILNPDQMRKLDQMRDAVRAEAIVHLAQWRWRGR